MKTPLSLLACLPLWQPAALRAAEPSTPPPTANATNWLAISGMHCEGCARGLTFELKQTPGVVHAEVGFTNQLARVVHDTNRVSLQNLQKVIAEAGYAARPVKPPKSARR